MKIHDLAGGVHPAYNKELSSEQAIRPLPMPKHLFIPLQQHVGALSVPIVAPGDLVQKGQVLCVRQGSFSATQHAPSSGKIISIEALTAPHASGLPQETIVIETDGEDAWGELPAPIDDPFTADPQQIIDRVAVSGIVGLGGAIFPAAIKLNMGQQYKLDTLLINGAECEPYLTCDDRLMREYADEVIDGARIMARALGVRRIILAVENNKPQAIASLEKASAAFSGISVAGVPVRYPVGYAQHLTKIVTGRETPAEHRNAEVGVVTHNVATARAVHQAVRFGRPLISRIVTVTGGAIRQPSNLEVLVGTPTQALIDFCGGFSQPPKQLVLGGLFLLVRRVISWHIPVAVIAGVLTPALIAHALDPNRYAGVLFHLFSGATFLGAFFIATDYVTSPVSRPGKLIFGAGCGLLTWIIRTYAGYPEGMAFAVLLMNGLTPIIDQYTRPRVFGRARDGKPLTFTGSLE